MATIKSKTERIKAKIKAMNNYIGRDVTKEPEFKNATGKHAAFGVGRIHWWRPDLDANEFKKFEKDYTLFSNPHHLSDKGTDENITDTILVILDGGGTFTSQADRVRRGLPLSDTSASGDMQTGGANYWFARIQKRTRMNTNRSGLYYKPRLIKRIDAFTYDHDAFGEVTRDYIQNRRRTTVEGFKEASAANVKNETIFRDGVSLFDDLDYIVVNNGEEKKYLVREMKKRGYSTWPNDGRPVEDVIKIRRHVI